MFTIELTKTTIVVIYILFTLITGICYVYFNNLIVNAIILVLTAGLSAWTGYTLALFDISDVMEEIQDKLNALEGNIEDEEED